MDSHLRQLALQSVNAYVFVTACEQHPRRKHGTEGEGLRELVAYWYRVHRQDKEKTSGNSSLLASD